MAALLERVRTMGAGLIGFAALAVVVLLQVTDPGPLARVRMQVFDAYQSLAPRETPTEAGRVAIVDIDEESIDRLGQWPWPRTDLAILAERLGEAGAAAVVFDIVFSEPDRTSPETVADRLESEGIDSALTTELAGLPGYDAQLAQSLAQVPAVTGYFLARDERGRAVEPKAGFTIHGSMPSEHVESYAGSLQPLAAIEAAASGSGFVSLESDADGIVRRVPLVAIHRDTLIPSLSLEAIRVARDAGSPNLQTSDGSGEGSSNPGAAVAVRIGEIEIPVNDAGEMWIHFPETTAQRILPAWQIITGKISDAELSAGVRDRIVVIGGSAAGLQDLVSTPLSERTAGVSVHAAAIDQILAGHFLQRPDWAFGLELVLVLLLGGALALLLPQLGALWGAVVAAGGIIASITASWLGFTQLGYLIDPTYPVLALAVVYSVQTVAVYYREERQRSYIHSAFDRFLSPEMVRQIAADPGKLELGGEEREMSVLMLDIRGFSRISEQYSPREVIDFLIEFLTPMSEILLDHRATLDKYIGDAILAFWNAPLDDPDHHRNAARAALAMVERLEHLNRSKTGATDGNWPGEVKIGIGLNSGLCCVGNMGSRQRLSYSLIGDTVNVAARLEGLTKQYGVPIIIGEDMARELDDFALLELDRVRVVGREGTETIFALLGDDSPSAQAQLADLAEAHAEMLVAYRSSEWDRAHAILAEHGDLYAKAGISDLRRLFAERVETLRAQPPGENWGGVFEATRK